MRMNFLDLMGQGNQSRDTSDTIYYLKTSTPHIHDIAVSGPYHDLESVHAQASHNFGSECSPGRSALEDFVRDGRHMAFEHIASPINGDPNRIKKTTLLRRQDAHLAAKLPCPVWNVVVSEVDSELKASGWAERNQMVPMKDMEIRQSYESEVAAKEKAREILQELVSSNEGCTSRIMRQTPFQAGVLDGQGPRFVVEVRYDGGLA
ncbi:hypothetical protein CLAFUW4_11244 [Fulvia fulva]|nr:hypothetical protein CLAFUR4_11250 [Fulvia fulva]KAK4620363.1 hypothetical protein CLAFUR0_11255 [Fulvia fulva]WPV17570.1 hypothetical protein CLAFUW4_11244 [Fulvia fulva]WPV31970.1 hypothetical protein CLAFUW7_11240 [Fulvia fulva]